MFPAFSVAMLDTMVVNRFAWFQDALWGANTLASAMEIRPMVDPGWLRLDTAERGPHRERREGREGRGDLNSSN